MPIRPNWTGLFICLGLVGGGGGGGGGGHSPPIMFIVCGTIATKFCIWIDNQSVSSNVEKNYKINNVIDIDVIILRRLAKKTVKRVYFKIAAASLSFIQSW